MKKAKKIIVYVVLALLLVVLLMPSINPLLDADGKTAAEQQLQETFGSLFSGVGTFSPAKLMTIAAVIILMVLFLLYAFIAPDENLMDRDTVALRNIMVLVTVLQMFVPLDRLAMRLNYYYLIFVPLLIPRVTNRFKVADKFITNVINIVMIVFFIGYFFLVNVSADNLGIFPYRFFWA
jgi:hypothetical protein